MHISVTKIFLTFLPWFCPTCKASCNLKIMRVNWVKSRLHLSVPSHQTLMTPPHDAEVWDETETQSSLSENECDADDSNKLTAVKQLHYTVCLLLSFFQLCFHISDRALTYLLSFLLALLKHFCSFIQSDYLTAFARMFPTTLYSMRKQLKLKSPYTTYIVCPKCHTLYQEADCFKTRSAGTTTSPQCTYIEFPNHPREATQK